MAKNVHRDTELASRKCQKSATVGSIDFSMHENFFLSNTVADTYLLSYKLV